MTPELRATYRIQLRPDFGFARAEELVPWLARLGVSHLYLSPCLQATRGSTHGYDVVDPTRANEELGGEEGFLSLARAAAEAGLGIVLDLVPNHMAIAGRENPWWWDVLENGPSSPFATYFDVEWENTPARWPNTVLLPVLGDHYGRILEAGELVLVREGGTFTVRYHENVFPIDPSSLSGLLARAARESGSEMLGFLAGSAERLPRPTVTGRELVARRHRDKAVLVSLVRDTARDDPAAARALDAAVARANADPDTLDELLDAQNYRLAFWRAADRDLGYRRFFDIQSLAGLRMEDEEVFAATHERPLAWYGRGLVQGFRIDHPDGLRDPLGYLERLRDAAPDALLYVEKILEPGEELPEDWPVAGTTGYDFLDLLEGLFVDPRGEEPLTRTWREFAGERASFSEVVLESKRLVLSELLGSELNRLTVHLVAVCERHRRHRDYTRHELREALLATAAAFPVYRSYVRAPTGEVNGADVEHVGTAVARAKENRPDLSPELLDFLARILLLEVSGEEEAELAMRFQQLTGPAMAKGVEDTAFYRYHRLVSLNEVGGDPARFGIAPGEFHRACETRAARRPRAMLAGSTHDTKRSEDVRARISELAGIPGRWDEVVRRWGERNERHRRDGLPGSEDEYLLYQTLVGAWPIDEERLFAYLEKAARESKRHTSWTRVDEEYEAALMGFAAGVLGDPEFVAELEELVGGIRPVARITGLARTLIRLTAPGVPDIYQGTELVDLSLVDPDNRRPVDFTKRVRLFHLLEGLTPEEILAHEEEGLAKLHLIRRALELRRERPGLFGPGAEYRPISPEGAGREHVVAYVRGGGAAVIVPRLVISRGAGWEEVRVALPAGRWENRLTGERVEGGDLPVGDLFARFPVALLASVEES